MRVCLCNDCIWWCRCYIFFTWLFVAFQNILFMTFSNTYLNNRTTVGFPLNIYHSLISLSSGGMCHTFSYGFTKKKRLPFFGHIHEIFWWIFTSFLMMMRRLNIALFVSISISNNCLIDFIDYGMFRSSKLKLFQLETTPVYICLCWSIFTFVYSSQAVWVYVFACKWFIWYKIGIL